jgi:hypothetical protein
MMTRGCRGQSISERINKVDSGLPMLTILPLLLCFLLALPCPLSVLFLIFIIVDPPRG